MSIDEQPQTAPASAHTDDITPVEGRIDHAVQSLSGVDALPLAEHHQHFERVHAQLRAALSDIDG